ncbi:MAG: tetratricopeptide repeat protein [Alphaproteobacteria bacterium]|nr:tetratricopeptide repeat protein [Alphaproteobacteria bacterium]
MPIGLMIAAGPAWAADPTVAEIHAAAVAGHVDQAQRMIGQVLKDHPNSAKAHYVEAELFAHQGRNAEARLDLETAQRLDPSMKFVSASSLAELKQQLGNRSASAQAVPSDQRERSHFPFGWIVLGVAALAFFVLFRRRQQINYVGSQGPSYGSSYGTGAYPSPGSPWGGPAAGGTGSGILSGLATGAAMGAGFAAGETLIDHMIDGDRGSRQDFNQPDAGSFDANQDMGGDNFGINDAGSWDDGGSDGGGSDDW